MQEYLEHVRLEQQLEHEDHVTHVETDDTAGTPEFEVTDAWLA